MMDGILSIRHYLDRMVDDPKCLGMKAFLLDAATTQIVSAVYSQTEILNKQVYLVCRIDDEKKNAENAEQDAVGHLKAICFCRPTAANIDFISRELNKANRFSEYHLFFSGILTPDLLRLLAEQDLHERIAQVQEFYADFLPLNSDLWTLQSRHSIIMTTAAGTSWAPKYRIQYERNVQGLQNMLLAMKKQPSVIRYAASSPCAEELAKDVFDSIKADDIFHFRRPTNSGGLLLLVLDRRDDPVTPLLSQWTYQAMVHELLGLNNHRVILKGAPNVPPDLHEVVLSASQDAFFAKSRHLNFGELGEAIQKLLREYQASHQQQQGALNTVEDMQKFMEKFPELKSQSHVVSKHVAIMGELARLVEVCSLMDVSQFEQELACADDHNAHWRELMEKLSSHSIKVPDKLRLGLLYALRYENLGNLHMVQQNMTKGGVPPDLVNLIPTMLRYAGSKSRGPGLYGESNVMAKMTKSIMSSVQGVENVYAQHVPLLIDTIQSALKGKLSIKTHPIVAGSAVGRPDAVPTEILIFMVGGVTYEEGTKIHELNQNYRARGIQVVLGGSTVHNSTSFLDELKATAL
mmetsp:Transcript_8410/g.11054  ORF Transcript_8410/g.11054 Transcript_8410/m.11054 type:complete len:577 (-) Transcript_8410:43-1773(-)